MKLNFQFPLVSLVLVAGCASLATNTPNAQPQTLTEEIKVTRDPIWGAVWRHNSTDWEDIAAIGKANHVDDIAVLFRFTGTDANGETIDTACPVYFRLRIDAERKASLAQSRPRSCIAGPDHSSALSGNSTSVDAVFERSADGLFVRVTMEGKIGSTPISGETLVERRKTFR